MMHEISYNNFHGERYVRLRGPAEGFKLSVKQARRWLKAMCNVNECICSSESDHYSKGSARIEPRSMPASVISFDPYTGPYEYWLIRADVSDES